MAERQRGAFRLRALSLLLALLVLSGCPSGGKTNNNQGQEAQRRVTTLRLGTLEYLPERFLPFTARTPLEVSIARKVWDTLTYFDPVTGEARPLIAQSWEEREEGMKFVFQLREGLKFADGSELDSEDVAASLAFAAALGPANPQVGQLFAFTDDWVEGAKDVWLGKADRIKGVETPDPRTVVIRLKHKNRLFPLVLSAVNFSIVPTEWVDENLEWARSQAPAEKVLAEFGSLSGDERLGVKEEELKYNYPPLSSTDKLPPASGPYQISQVGKEGIQLRANPQWGLGRPLVREVSIRSYSKGEELARAFEKGELDVVEVPPLVYGKIRAGGLRFDQLPPHQEVRVELYSLFYIGMNLRADPYREIPLENRAALRRAVGFHMNRGVWSERMFGTLHKPLNDLIPRASPLFNKEFELSPFYTYDPGRAAELLAKSEHPQGFYLPPHRFWYRADDEEQYALGRAILDEMNDLAFPIVDSPAPLGAWEKRVERGLAILWLERFDYPYPDPDSIFFTRMLGALGTSRNRWQLGNFAGFNDPAYNEKIIRAREVDRPSARFQLYDSLVRRLQSRGEVVFLLSRGADFWIRKGAEFIRPSGMDYGPTLPGSKLAELSGARG